MSESINIPQLAKESVYRFGCAMSPNHLTSQIIEAYELSLSPEDENDLIEEIELCQSQVKESLDDDNLTQGDIVPTLIKYDEDDLDFVQG